MTNPCFEDYLSQGLASGYIWMSDSIFRYSHGENLFIQKVALTKDWAKYKTPIYKRLPGIYSLLYSPEFSPHTSHYIFTFYSL